MGINAAWRSWLALISVALSTVILSGPAQGAEARAIEEVVVTARRTAENLQDVPIAVTALTSTDLVQQNLVRPNDLMYTVPSLTTAPYISTFNNTYAIRGLPTGVVTYLGESACCIGNTSVPFMDIQSVQVLNGPQGTLFGRSSAAGSVLIEPVRPNLNEREAYVNIRAGDYSRREFSGTVNLPIIADSLAVRLAASSMHVDGYTSQIGGGEKFDEQNNQQARLGIQYHGDRFSNYTAVNFVNVDQSASSSVLVGSNTNVFPYNLPAVFAPYVYGAPCAQAVSIGLNPDVDSCVAQRQGMVDGITAALIAEQARLDNGGDSAIRQIPGVVGGQPILMRLENWSLLNVAEFGDIDLGRVQVSIKDVFSYELAQSVLAGPGDGVGGQIQQQGAIQFVTGAPFGSSNTLNGRPVPRLGPWSKTLNNDLNVHFDVDDGLLEAVLGYYYARHDLPGSNEGTSTIYQLWLGILSPDLAYQSAFDFNHDSYTRERAWYTQGTLDVSRIGVPGLKLTVGYRKSWDKSYASGYTPVYDLATGTYFPGPTLNEAGEDSSGYNYLVTLAQQFTETIMVYLTNSRAYVPGGINSINEGSEVPNYSPTYGPETVTAWELGAKLDFLIGDDIPVRLNAAIYQYDFEDIIVPFQAFNGTASIGFQANAAAAELNGYELSGTIIPIDDLTISFAYNYNDAKYTDWVATDPFNVAQPGDPNCVAGSNALNCLVDLSNNPFASMPEHQGHVTVAYGLPLDSSVGNVTLSATWYAQSLVWFDASSARYLELLPDATPGISQASYSILNLRAHWSNVIDSGADVALFASNVTDEVYKLGATPQLLSLGFSIGTYGPPRMVGLEISKHF